MKEYRLFYKRPSNGGYNIAVDVFSAATDHPQYDDWPSKYETDDDARYAAYARLETVKADWAEFNKYPYGEPKIFEREVGEWENIT